MYGLSARTVFTPCGQTDQEPVKLLKVSFTSHKLTFFCQKYKIYKTAGTWFRFILSDPSGSANKYFDSCIILQLLMCFKHSKL